MKKLALSLLAAATLTLAAPAARADATADARVLFEVGSKAYRLGDYRAAIQAFEQAYRVEARPGLLFSIGQAHKRQYYVDRRPGHVAVAIKRYNEYLAQVAQGGRRADVTAALAELTPIADKLQQDGQLVATTDAETATRLMISTPAHGATITIDGEAKPVAAPLIAEVKAGKHTIALHADGYIDEKREIEVPAGAVTALDIPLKDRPALLAVDAPAGASVSVDNRVVGVTPLASPAEIGFGPHHVHVTLAGHASHDQNIEVRRGERFTLVATMPMTFQRKASLGLMLGGGVVALTGAVLGGVALGFQADANGIQDRMNEGQVVCRAPTCPELDRYNSAVATRDGLRAGAGALLGVGIAAAGGGAFLYFFDDVFAPRKAGDAPGASPKAAVNGSHVQLSAAPVVAPGYYGTALVGRF